MLQRFKAVLGLDERSPTSRRDASLRREEPRVTVDVVPRLWRGLTSEGRLRGSLGRGIFESLKRRSPHRDLRDGPFSCPISAGERGARRCYAAADVVVVRRSTRRSDWSCSRRVLGQAGRCDEGRRSSRGHRRSRERSPRRAGDVSSDRRGRRRPAGGCLDAKRLGGGARKSEHVRLARGRARPSRSTTTSAGRMNR